MFKNLIQAGNFGGRKLLVTFIGSLLVIMGVFLWPNTAYMSSIEPDKIIELTNKERIKAGLNELSQNDLLTQAAEGKAHAIFDSESFSHTINGEKFSTWIKKTGYKYTFVGENLAMDFMTSEGIVNAWLQSKTHKENLLNNEYREIGVAVKEGKFKGQNTIVVVQVFGAPENIIPQPKISGGEFDFSFIPSNGTENFKSEILITDLAEGKPILLTNLNYNLNDSTINENVNTFFEQEQFIKTMNYLNTFLPYLFLCLIFYLYFFYFSFFKTRII